jgi:class 3 adenylate cyclase
VGEERKVAAILAADVVGYSRLTGADEEATLARMRNLRSELLNPAVEAHGCAPILKVRGADRADAEETSISRGEIVLRSSMRMSRDERRGPAHGQRLRLLPRVSSKE